VGVFQTYKHWHNKAIERSIERLEFDYGISHFFHDLHEIRQATFSILTIKHAFKKSGIWPQNLKQVKKNMAKYVQYSVKEQAKEELPRLPQTPHTIRHVQEHLTQLLPKIIELLSSPSQARLDSFYRGTRNTLTEAEIVQHEKEMLFTRVIEFQDKKPYSQKRLQKGSILVGEEAQVLIERKEQEEKVKAQRKIDWMLQKHIRDNKKALHRLGIDRRKAERGRKAELKCLLPDDIGAAHLQVNIPDPETEAKHAKEALLPSLQLSTQLINAIQEQEEIEEREEAEEQVVIRTQGQWEGQWKGGRNPIAEGDDFITFPESNISNISEGSISSSLSESESDG